MFNNISVGSRITLILGIIILLLTSGAGFSIYQLSQSTTGMKQAIEVDLELARRAERWGLLVQVNVARAFVRANVDLGTYRHIFETDSKAMSDQIGRAQASMEELVTDETMRAELNKVIDVRKKTVAITDHIAVLKASSDQKTVETYIRETYEPQAKFYLASLQGLADFAYEQARIKVEEIEHYNQLLTLYISILLAATVLLAFYLARSLSKSILVPLVNAVQIAQNIARGDLSREAKRIGTAEFGMLSAALHGMQESLSEKFTDMYHASASITGATQEINDGNKSLSERTDYQMSSLERTGMAMNELTETVRNNASNAQEAHSLVDATSALAKEGGDIMNHVVDKMKEINDASRQIADIISVIDSIAFQTNILALNAAVEAARAGEQGRGFAVVASEVRNLAQRSATSAKEIKILIDSSVEKINQEDKMIGQAGDKILQIVDSVQKITTTMSEINAASQEQRAQIESINGVFSDLEKIAQQNAMQVKDADKSADMLKDQSDNLASIVGTFKLKDANTGFMQPAHHHDAIVDDDDDEDFDTPSTPRLPG